MQLKRLFENLFDSGEISRQQLRLFVEDFLKRLAVQNTSGQYSAMLASTQAAYDAYFGNVSKHDAAVATRQSRTKNMSNALDAFKAAVVRQRKLISFHFKEDSPEYLEFFPAMAKEYSEATLENVETLMKRIAAVSATYQAKLGADTANEFAAALAGFQQARGEQLSQKGSVGTASSNTVGSSTALQLQMTDNVLAIARNYIGQPTAAKLFFDESLLASPQTKKEEPAFNAV